MGQFTVEPLDIAGVLLVHARRHVDARGHFMEIYSASAFLELGILDSFVQDNQSLSDKCGTVRGLHFQTPPHAQAKLVRVLRGSIFDVAVDLRMGSPTFGRWTSAKLTAERAEQLYVPIGFAHGFCTLEAGTEVAYKVSNLYVPQHDAGIRWDDPELGIEWPVAAENAIVSEKDAGLPPLRQITSPFIFQGTSCGGS